MGRPEKVVVGVRLRGIVVGLDRSRNDLRRRRGGEGCGVLVVVIWRFVGRFYQLVSFVVYNGRFYLSLVRCFICRL